MDKDQSSLTPTGSNIVPLLDRPQVREWLRLQLGTWLADSYHSLNESQAVDDAIMVGKHGFGIPQQVLTDSLDRLTDLLSPASDDVVIRSLLKCHSLTAKKDQDGINADIMIEAYAEELREFPADVVERVLGNWPKANKWFPTLAEIYPDLLQGVAYRVRARNWVEAEMSYGSSEQVS